MIYCDQWIMEFMKYNALTFTFVFSLLKMLAGRSDAFAGDSILDLFKSIFVKK